MKKFFFAIALSVAVLCSISALRAAPKSTARAKIAEPLRLAFVTNNASDFWTVARKGVELAAQHYAVQVHFRVPAEGTAAEQKQVVEDLLSVGREGIAISPVDPENQTALLNSVASKMLLFTQDSDAPKSKRACYIGPDNVAAGRQAGAALKRALPAGGEAMIFVGKADAQNARERIQGLREAIKGSKIRVLGTRVDDTDRALAVSNVTDALHNHPKLTACVGIWSYNGPAILLAAHNAGKIGKIKIVCFDEEEDTLEGVRTGAISATIVQQPFEFGYQSIALMAKYLRGDHSVIPANKRVIIPTLTITKNNLASYAARLKALRGR